MHSRWVDGPASTPQHLHYAGLDKARDDTQNVVGDLRRRVSEAEMNLSNAKYESRGLGVGRYR
jgi:hypothetical protein